MSSDLASMLRWAHQANIERYERLLRTRLTDHERSFIERRIVEEREALAQPVKATAPSAASTL